MSVTFQRVYFGYASKTDGHDYGGTLCRRRSIWPTRSLDLASSKHITSLQGIELLDVKNSNKQAVNYEDLRL